jgi:hypothetical protein
MPRRLRVRLDDLVNAFVDGSSDRQYYFDLETGDVVLISDDTRKNLEDMYDELIAYEEDGPWAIQRQLEDRGFNEQEQAGVLALFLMEGGYGLRYVAMPQASANYATREMEEFIATVQDREMAERLARALNDRTPFRRFHDVVSETPGERERWEAYREQRARQRVLDWLAGQGIEPVPA